MSWEMSFSSAFYGRGQESSPSVRKQAQVCEKGREEPQPYKSSSLEQLQVFRGIHKFWGSQKPLASNYKAPRGLPVLWFRGSSRSGISK